MSDLIDRQAAIDAFWHIRCNLQMMDDTQTADKMMHGLRLAENAVEQLPSANQWIPCSERLPERGGAYFVTGKMKYEHENKWQYFTDVAYNFGSYIDDYWGTCNDWDEGQEIHIIAWMPLPEPWEGEEK